MPKTLLVILALVSAGGLASLAVPASAESEGHDEAACLTQPGETDAGPIDLSQVPVNPVTGPQAVQGVDDDECDDVAAGSHDDDGVRAAINIEHEGPREVEDRD